MGLTVCLFPTGTLGYPNGGGYLWIYLNWALGFRALGCKVVWLESVSAKAAAQKIQDSVTILKERLKRYGLAESIALCSYSGKPLPAAMTDGCLTLEDAADDADLLLNQRYGAPAAVVERFRRSALLDIDPGLLQTWISKGWVNVARHDVYFSISEAAAQKGSQFPDAGLKWHHAAPCVALDWWPAHKAAAGAAFTTLTHWYASGGAVDTNEAYADDKRSGFLPFLELPEHTSQPLEIALDVAFDNNECSKLQAHGWRVCDAYAVAPTPEDFLNYVQASLGEFSCAKPSYIRLQTAWVSDRTVCYLASGKPAIVQDTGPSRYLPSAAGLFRFRNLNEAAHSLDRVASDYERQCKLARSLAEEYFDARKVARSVLERALP